VCPPKEKRGWSGKRPRGLAVCLGSHSAEGGLLGTWHVCPRKDLLILCNTLQVHAGFVRNVVNPGNREQKIVSYLRLCEMCARWLGLFPSPDVFFVH
jgi:hypothetical protein